METKEWQLKINDAGDVFVQHITVPRFTAQIIICGNEVGLCVNFKMDWLDAQQGGFDWHFKALEFYSNVPRPKFQKLKD